MSRIVFSITLLTFQIWSFAQLDPTAQLLGTDCMKSGSASIMVYDLDNNIEVYKFDAERALPTASIQKLLTTAAVLYKRGKGFKYETSIGYTGSITKNHLNGNLVIKGNGDPSLGSVYFDDIWNIDRIRDSLVLHLSEIGVRGIYGDIVIDVSSVPGLHVPKGWPWSDLGNYYGAGHWALNINDNEYKVLFRQNQTPGQLTNILRTSPVLHPFTLVNEVRTGPVGSGDRAYIFSAPYSTGATIRGTIPPGKGSFSIRGSLTNPPEFFGQQLSASLIQSSINLTGTVKISAKPVQSTQALFNITSPSLLDIIRVTNFHSVNLYAEGLLKLLCDQKTESQFECGLDALESFWEDRGVDEEQFFFQDGSGLSPRNTASASVFVQALKAIHDDSSWYNAYLSSLPEMGKEGTLRYMLRGYKGSGHILAKSGYIGRQRSYAGYISSESGRHLAFCVLLDNYGCSSTMMRQRIERFLISYLKS